MTKSDEVKILRNALRNLLVMLPSELSTADVAETDRIPVAFCFVRWIDIKEGHMALASIKETMHD